MPHVIWTRIEGTKDYAGYVSDTEQRFTIKESARRYGLSDGIRDIPSAQRTSIAKCKERAEEYMEAEKFATSANVEAHPDTDEACPANDGPVIRTAIVGASKGAKVLGEVIAWQPGDGTRTHAAVVAALTEADLDPTVAKELLPRYAFSRACKKLESDRIIESCPGKDVGGVLAYQFTGKVPDATANEWLYRTETILWIDKDTGVVSCPLATATPEFVAGVQQLVNDALANKTGQDITRIVQRLFDRRGADLFAVRNQGGCYFVPRQHIDFVAQVQRFLEALGGSMNRFPVADPDGTGCGSVTDAVTSGLEAVLQEHEAAVAEFSVTTHQDTLEAMAKKISDTRVKVEAYADYLADKKGDLLKAIEGANAKLLLKIEARAVEVEWSQPQTFRFGGESPEVGVDSTTASR